ncbi:phage fiber-tail adaptor protein [Acetobacter pasteurianus]
MPPPIPFPIWQPAWAQTIVIPEPTNLRARGLVASIIPLSWAPKSSAKNFDFSLNASEILCCTNDYIFHVSASVLTAQGLPTDLSVSWCSIVDGLTCVLLGGGEPGTTQTVNVEITTQQGRVISQDVLIAIVSGVASIANPVTEFSDRNPVISNALRLPDNSILALDRSHTNQISLDRLLSTDGTHLTSPSGADLLNQIFQTWTDVLFIA